MACSGLSVGESIRGNEVGPGPGPGPGLKGGGPEGAG